MADDTEAPRADAACVAVRERDEARRVLRGVVECFPQAWHPAIREARDLLSRTPSTGPSDG